MRFGITESLPSHSTKGLASRTAHFNRLPKCLNNAILIAIVLFVKVQTANFSGKKLDGANIRKTAIFALKSCKLDINLSIVIVNDKLMLSLNKRHLSHNYKTDVLAFMLQKDFKWETDAEVIVCYDQAKRMSRSLGIPFKQELLRYLVHGILHLKGYNDKKPRDRKKMWSKQEEILNSK